MPELQPKTSRQPPQKQRDPLLVGRNKDELMRQQEEYVRETLKSAARESLRQGTILPKSIVVGRKGLDKLRELQGRLRVESKILLNMALVYAYTEAQQQNIPVAELRAKVKETLLDDESVDFEIDELTLEILLDSGIADAEFVYLNAGIELLYSRLIDSSPLSEVGK